MHLTKEYIFDTAEEFLTALTPWSNKKYFPDNLIQYIFRGHPDDDYKLVPSALRKDDIFWEIEKYGLSMGSGERDNTISHINHEFKILRSFYKKADRAGLKLPRADRIRESLIDDDDPGYFHPVSNIIRSYLIDLKPDDERFLLWLPDDLMELAGIAQHYGLPTRLLDWTYDPLVAAYFASKNAPPEKFISVWAMRRTRVRFSSHILETTMNKIKFVTPPYFDNPNLAAQSGLFTCWQIPIKVNYQGFVDESIPINRSPLDILLHDKIAEIRHTHKIDIFNQDQDHMFIKLKTPSNNSHHIKLLLDRIGYNAARLFPGYQGVTNQMKEIVYDPYP